MIIMTRRKKIGIAIVAALCGCVLLAPATSSADDEVLPSANAPAAVEDEGEAVETTPSAETTPAEGPCSVTLQYYENVGYEDPDVTPGEDGRILLGERVVSGLHEGDVLDTWDYVVNIPGHFFFDAWPAKLTVSSDPANNVIKLFYFKLWNNQFTVNYYLMEGADLTADTWAGALAPEGVEFIKLGSETFTDVRYDKLVEGDAYEYEIDGTYVVDAYPSQIRVGLNPDENVINVLYVPDSMRLPDDVPIPDTMAPEPDDAITPDDETPPSAPPSSSSASGSTGSADGASPALPPDATLDEDELHELLTDDSDSQDVQNDFLGTDVGEGELVITDEMLANPVDREQAQITVEAYRTGLSQGSALAATGDEAVGRLAVALAIAVAAAAVSGCAIVLVARRRNNDDKTDS
ncbi:hypothetical protein [Adlercreutzia sp. ZJ242]|uniref:hypothetical protein n=1 Tax=Adlercreutzia sp. ZJ242 TaxID=2709409 RepID=UPI001980E977|nr:hypothetical protein [Adlercreutzia sp. ZJ242]